MIGRKAERVAYGTHESQFVEVWAPPGSTNLTLVLVHGGFWRLQYRLDLMDGLCVDAVQRGRRAINVEYRRGRGWPAMADDVRSAWATAVEISGDEPMVTIGHSAGGHLVLWAAAKCSPKPTLAVSLAGVADLALARKLGIGAEAVRELLGDAPMAPVDPARLLPTGVPTLLVAPTSDRHVPSEVSVSFADKARGAGDPVRLIEPPGDHMAVIDPTSDAWAQTCAQISELVAAG